MSVFISIHALLAESDHRAQNQAARWMGISIHALLAESDSHVAPVGVGAQQISIHALLAESDWSRWPNLTLSADFYPRSPCGERPELLKMALTMQIISIHALLAESDFLTLTVRNCSADISIHALLAESDSASLWLDWLFPISIHALLAESDKSARLWIWMTVNFYPRSPCGERHTYHRIFGEGE